jgi:hypothetical protein
MNIYLETDATTQQEAESNCVAAGFGCCGRCNMAQQAQHALKLVRFRIHSGTVDQ